VKGETDRWPELQEVATGNDELLPIPASWPALEEGDDLCGHQRNPIFVLHEGERYHDISAELGLCETPVTRAIALADVDGDCDLDLAYGNQWEPSTFHRNEVEKDNKALVLRLRHSLNPAATYLVEQDSAPALASRAAVGARARLRLPDGRLLSGQVDGGNGHSGIRGKELHFGLGAVEDDLALQVELEWRDPTGLIQSAELELVPGRHTIVLGWKGVNQ
jgi:hypothetical protein